MRVVSLLVLLLLAHLVLAHWSGHAGDAWPQLTMLALQATALWAVFTRYRRSPTLIRLPWLLLALAVLMQVLWGCTNLLGMVLGDKGGYLYALATVFSSLYLIPCMFMVSRSFVRDEPRVVMWLDLVMSCVIAILLYEFFTHMLSGPLAKDPSSIYVVVYDADVMTFRSLSWPFCACSARAAFAGVSFTTRQAAICWSMRSLRPSTIE